MMGGLPMVDLIKSIEFANPGFLYLLLVIPFLVVWYFFRRKRASAELQVSTLQGFAKNRRSFRLVVMEALYFLRLLAFAVLIVALARPQTSLSRQDISVEGIDLVFALDISSSMLARDFRPDRLGAAKDVAIEFVDARPSDRMGLVVFSGESFTQCPLTTDHSVVKNLFRDVKSGMIEDGTALGDGLATAVNRLRESKAVSKVIILLTDGVNNSGSLDPRSAAEIAKLYGIRIYTIGIGTLGMAPYPVQTPFGVQVQMVPVEIDEPLLREIAQMTNGKYFRATNNDKLRAIYKEIDQLEKSKIDVTEFRRKNEQFLPLLYLSFILVAIELALRYFFVKNIP
jgi:Ca-activated chloride channel family protein